MGGRWEEVGGRGRGESKEVGVGEGRRSTQHVYSGTPFKIGSLINEAS